MGSKTIDYQDICGTLKLHNDTKVPMATCWNLQG